MDEWETGSEAGDAVLYSTGLQTAARDGSDLGGAVNTAERLILGICTAEEGGSKDRLRRGKEEEEEEKQKQERGQKKGALNRSRKSGKKKKEKEEGRKSFAGVISKFFGKSSTHEEKETINGLQSNARGAEKHRQPSEANNNNDDDDDYYDDDDDDEEAMWSDGEFDEEFDDDDEVYSNVDELRVDLVAKIEIEVTTTTTTTKSTSASTKDTVTTTNDLIIFEPEDAEDEVRREVEEKKEEKTLADTEIDRSSVAKPSGKVLAGVPLSRRCNEIDYDLSKNIDHDQSRSVDKDRQDQETDRMPSIQSARRFFEVDSNFKKSAASELGKDKGRIQNFGSENKAKKLEPKRVIEKPDILDFTKTKTTNSNDKAGSIRQPGEENQQAQRALNTASKSTVPTGRQTGVWSGTTSPINRFANKQCTAAAAAAAAEQPPRTATKGRSATGSGGGSPSGGGEGEGASDANRSKIAAVHSLVKLFDTTEARCRSPDLNRTPRPAKDVVPTPQQRLTGDSRRELGTREKPALKKKPIVETPKQPNSARLFTATPMTCPAPPVLPTRGANPGKRSPPTGSGLPGSRHPPGSRTGPSSTVPSDNAATVNRVYLPPVPRASSKEPSKIGAKDIPNAGATTPQQDNRVNQVGELRKTLRKAPEKYNEEPLVGRSSSKQSPSLPYRPPKFQANGVVEGNVYGPKIDRLNEKEMAEKQLEQLEQQVWYFGDSSREECEARLQSLGQNGTFVVRRSKFGGEKCPYTLSVFLDQATVSLSIRRRTDNTFALGTEKANEMVYSDVMEIVRFHRVNPVRLHNGKTLTLKTSPPK